MAQFDLFLPPKQSTFRYRGVEVDNALEMSEQIGL
jgi:hypothetical protein